MFENATINKSIPVPIYYQLKNLILSEIRSGELKPGDMLPAELEIQNRFQISRTTVRQALSELVAEEVVYRIKGKVTFIAMPKITHDFMRRLEPFSEQMKRVNAIPKTQVLALEYMEPATEVQEALGLPEKAQCIHMRRLRFAGDVPVVLVDTYLQAACSPVMERDMEKNSLYDTLGLNPNTKIVRVCRSIEAANAGNSTTKYFEIPLGTAIQLTRTTGYNAADQPVEYSVARYPGDRNRFIVELRVE